MLRSWLVIGVIAIALPGLSTVYADPQGVAWFRRLRRPAWLTFEGLIPLIWITIFICGAWSAVIVWETQPHTTSTWGLMAGYLALELVTLAYTPVMQWVRKLRVGTVIGALGFGLALLLAIAVAPVAIAATWLLLPYLLWSPIGTFTTWQMERLNPGH